MANFEFCDNSKELFEALAKAGPLPMRGIIRRALTKALSEVAGGDTASVEPQMVVQAVKQSTPRPFLNSALKSISGMHRCQTLCPGCTASCGLAP